MWGSLATRLWILTIQKRETRQHWSRSCAVSSDPQHLQARRNGERKTSCHHLARCAHPAVKPQQTPMTGQRVGCVQQPQPTTPCACGSRLHLPKSATSYPVPTRSRARCWHCDEHRCPSLLATWTADRRRRRRAPARAETPALPRSRPGEEGGALFPSRSSAVLSSAASGAHMCQVRRCSRAKVLVRKVGGKERATKTARALVPIALVHTPAHAHAKAPSDPTDGTIHAAVCRVAVSQLVRPPSLIRPSLLVYASAGGRSSSRVRGAACWTSARTCERGMRNETRPVMLGQLSYAPCKCESKALRREGASERERACARESQGEQTREKEQASERASESAR